MTDSASGKHHGSRVPGRPIQPGQVLNPTGKNQFTYRKAWEREIDQALNSAAEGDRGTTLQALADKLLSEALKGKPWAMQLVLKRVWPETVKHEVREEPPQPPAFTPLENLNEEDRATMLRLAQKAIRGGNK
jgi:hypothetical protein